MTSPEETDNTLPPARLGRYAAANRWLEKNIWLPVVLVTLAGLIARVLTALPTMLNPDESIHVMLSSAPSLATVYKVDLGGPDPSLLHFLLFPLCKLFASDLVLRLPSILAGTAAIAVGYLWLAELFDRVTGLVGALLLAFAPSVLFVSCEIRAYAILIGFSVSSLYFLESALRRGSAVRMAFFGVFQCLALASQYSALVVIATAGAYSLYVILRTRVRGRVLWAWLASEAVTLALAVFLYVTQLARVHGSTLEAGMKTGFLSDAYFKPGRETLVSFITSRTALAFNFLFTDRTIGLVALALFLAGLALLFVRGIERDGTRGRREVGFLVLAPWAATAAGGVLGLYPYSGTRHIVLLMLFAVPAIAWLVRRVAGARPVPILAAALVLVPLWESHWLEFAAGWQIPLDGARRSHVMEAVNFVRQDAPGGAIVFTDLEAHAVLCHYLFRGHAGTTPSTPNGFMESDWDGYKAVTPTFWSLAADSFGDEFQRMAEAYGLEPGTKVYVVSCGWIRNMPHRLEAMGIHYPDAHIYSDRSAAMVVAVGDEVLSDAREREVSHRRRSLEALASMLAANAARRVAAVIWPSSYLDSTAQALSQPLTLQAIPYSLFYSSLISGSMDMGSYAPAIALWVFGTRERHLAAFTPMADTDNYVAGGLRFTLLATGPERLTAAYLVEPAGP